MFTGIIEQVARVNKIEKSENFITLEILSSFSNEIKVGDSISVNGVCLTATYTDVDFFRVNIIRETLDKTNFKDIDNSSYVNIERALKLSSRIDGHILQGHIESTVSIAKKEIFDNQANYTIEVKEQFLKYCIQKGSIALDGISLTIANIANEFIDVAIIPHTLENTTLKYKKVGDVLNLETDMFAKYIEKIINKN